MYNSILFCFHISTALLNFVQTATTEEEQVTENYRRSTLHKAAEEGNLNGVKYFVEVRHANVNGENIHDNTSLHLAAASGHLDVVKYLLDRGANVRGNYLSMTPLHLSAQNGHLEIVKYLVEKGANNKDNNYYENVNPLYLTTVKGHLEVIKYLIDNGAAVNSTIDYGTLLLVSLRNGHIDAAKYLVEKGANVNSSDGYKKPPLCYAAENGSLPLVRYFLEKGASISYNTTKIYIDGKVTQVRSVLPCAARSGNLTVVKYLVDLGADVNGMDERDVTPMLAAVAQGYLSVVKYLVENGADVNYQGELFEVATDNGHLDMVKYLVANGVHKRPIVCYFTLILAIKKGDIDFVKYLVEKENTSPDIWVNGYKPMHAAVKEGKFDIALYLLDRSDEIDSWNLDGFTILHQAVDKGALDLVKYLVENKGMDVNIKTKFSEKTPLNVVIERNNTGLAEYLVSHGAEVNGTFLRDAVSTGNLPMVKTLVNLGANVNMKDNHGVTPLHVAARNGYLNIVKYLVEKGANANTADRNGETPLAMAADKCYLDIVQHLRKDEPQATEEPPQFIEEQETEDSEYTCELGKDSLQAAAQQGDLSKLKCLVAKGADLNAKDESGLTPLHKAAIYRPNFGKRGLNIIQYLVRNGADVNAKSSIGLRSFLEDGVGLGSKRKSGRTPLHYAAIHGTTSFSVVNGRITGGCLKGNLDTAQYLVYKGADFTARDEDGLTPLELTRKICNPEVLQFLLKKCGIRTPERPAQQ